MLPSRITARMTLAVTAPLLLLLLAACDSSGPTMSGFPVGNTRMVKVDEIVEVRLPMHPDGSRQWRVVSFDSLYLVPVGREVARDAKGHPYQLVRARAKNPGQTRVEIVQVPGPSNRGTSEPQMRVFDVQIRE